MDGKLVETDQEPRNVQVNLEETEGGMAIGLRDVSGVFLEAPPNRIKDKSKEDSKRESDGTNASACDNTRAIM